MKTTQATTGFTATTRRDFIRAGSILTVSTLAGRGFAAGTSDRMKTDVCIYGATSGGIIAAVALAKLGRSVVLVEPTRHIGGMTTGGIGHVDFGRPEAIGGLTRKYFDEIMEHYRKAGIDDGGGWNVEPHVAEDVFNQWVAASGIEVIREARLASVEKEGSRIRSMTLDKAGVDGRGAPLAEAKEANFVTISAAIFMDCTYEGDLLDQAGVGYRIGREARSEFDEPIAGTVRLPLDSNGTFGYTHPNYPAKKKLLIDPYVRPGDSASGLLPFISPASPQADGSASNVVQAYCFRLCMTKENPLPVAPPSGYEASRFELFRRYISGLEAIGDPIWEGDLFHGFGMKQRYPHARLMKITRMVGHKTDVNNGGSVSMDFVTGGAERYAKANWAERAKTWHDHEDYQRGLLYYLRTEEGIPEWLRSTVGEWGLCRDEFQDTGGWPNQLYIREARRMVGSHVMSQSECDNPQPREDSIGQGAYSLDSHLCQRLVDDGAVINEGGFFHRITKAYPIPYTVIVPKAEECENLFVTFCVSATHAAFASFRMEPPFMILCESAAYAADEALRSGSAVQGVDVAKLRARLKDAGQVL